MRGEGLGGGGSAGPARALLGDTAPPSARPPLPGILGPQDPPMLRAARTWGAGRHCTGEAVKVQRPARGRGASETPARPRHGCACERALRMPARPSAWWRWLVAVTQAAVPGRLPPRWVRLVGAETIPPLPLAPGLAVCSVSRRAQREPEGHASVFHSRALGPLARPPRSHPAPVGIARHTARRWQAPGRWAA